MPNAHEESVLSLLDTNRALIHHEDIPIRDHSSLKIQVIKQELQEEVEALTTMLKADDFAENFKVRCKMRATLNTEETCLNFFKMPKGACNQLYGDIAIILFQPKTLGELLSVLVPDITTCIAPNLESDASILFQERPITSLTQPASLSDLACFVASGHHLFDTRDIACFDFGLHERHRAALSHTYPHIEKRLFQHNAALKTLLSQLLMINGQGETPKSVIQSFSNELRMGGINMTGCVEANISSAIAMTDFMGYLATLPIEIKAALLLLKSPANTIEGVMDALHDGGCVEQAAQRLQFILENSVNQAFLNTPPRFSSTQLETISQSYGLANPLPTFGEDSITRLPTLHLEKALPHVTISTGHDYLSLLLIFPATLYMKLSQQASMLAKLPLPFALSALVQQGALNEEQQRAFIEAIVSCCEKNGDLEALINFANWWGNADLITQILQRIASGQLLEALKGKKPESHIALHFSVKHPASLRAILQLYTEEDDQLLADTLHKNGDDETILHQTVGDLETLQIILQSLPINSRLPALKETNADNRTVLDLLAPTPKSLRESLRLLPEAVRVDALEALFLSSNCEVLQILANDEETIALLPPTIIKTFQMNLDHATTAMQQLLMAGKSGHQFFFVADSGSNPLESCSFSLIRGCCLIRKSIDKAAEILKVSRIMLESFLEDKHLTFEQIKKMSPEEVSRGEGESVGKRARLE